MDTTHALPAGALGLRAYAKVNLHLEVLRQRPDGYHDIETVLQSIGLFDTLHLVPRPAGLTLLCDAPGVPTGEENLSLRAARVLLEAVGRTEPPRGVRLDLYKSIPVAAGCGGASADAAATLVGLNTFWKLGLSMEELETLARRLGSDVPFCVRGGTALARGRGEKLVALPALRRTTFVMVFPGIPVLAGWAYSNLNMGLTRRPHALNLDRLKSILARYPEAAPGFYNRLEDAVCPTHPQLAEIVARLQEGGASVAMMTGSGSGVFGAFPHRSMAERVGQALRRGAWLVRVVDSVRTGVEFFQ
jgi:4-diphosphocytidyl-2-C-methyl-D-erythritol kinase